MNPRVLVLLFLMLSACLLGGWLLERGRGGSTASLTFAEAEQRVTPKRGESQELTPIEEVTDKAKIPERIALRPDESEHTSASSAGRTWRLEVIDEVTGEEVRSSVILEDEWGISFRREYSREQLRSLPHDWLGLKLRVSVRGYYSAELDTSSGDRNQTVHLRRKRDLRVSFTSSLDLFSNPQDGPLDYEIVSDTRTILADRMRSLPGPQRFELGAETRVWVRVTMPSNVGGVIPLLELAHDLEEFGDTEILVDLSAVRRPATTNARIVLSFIDVDFEVKGTISEIYACDSLGEREPGTKHKRIDLYSWKLGEEKGKYELLCQDLSPGNYTLALSPMEFEHTFQVYASKEEALVNVSVPKLHRITLSPRNEKEQLLVPKDVGQLFWGDFGESGSRQLFNSLKEGSTDGLESGLNSGLLRSHDPGLRRWSLGVLPGRNLWLYLRGKYGYASRVHSVQRTGGHSELEWVMKKER